MGYRAVYELTFILLYIVVASDDVNSLRITYVGILNHDFWGKLLLHSS